MPSKPTAPRVTFLDPPKTLRRAFLPGPATSGDHGAIEKADEALCKLSAHFEEWMQDNLQRLNIAVADLTKTGITEDSLDTLFRAAHDLRSDSQTFGFSLAADVSNSFCQYLEAARVNGQAPVAVIEKFSQAISAMSKTCSNAKEKQIAEILTEALRVLAREQQAKAAAKLEEMDEQVD